MSPYLARARPGEMVRSYASNRPEGNESARCQYGSATAKNRRQPPGDAGASSGAASTDPESVRMLYPDNERLLHFGDDARGGF